MTSDEIQIFRDLFESMADVRSAAVELRSEAENTAPDEMVVWLGLVNRAISEIKLLQGVLNPVRDRLVDGIVEGAQSDYHDVAALLKIDPDLRHSARAAFQVADRLDHRK